MTWAKSSFHLVWEDLRELVIFQLTMGKMAPESEALVYLFIGTGLYLAAPPCLFLHGTLHLPFAEVLR